MHTTDIDMMTTIKFLANQPPFVTQVVNVAQGMSLGPALYLWTHRVTNADVVSVITTAQPFIDDDAEGADPLPIRGSGGRAFRGLPFSGSFGPRGGAFTTTLTTHTL